MRISDYANADARKKFVIFLMDQLTTTEKLFKHCNFEVK